MRDGYGSQYARGVREAIDAHGRGMAIGGSVSYLPEEEATMAWAMDSLFTSGVSIVVCIAHEAEV